ncbi:Ankyrin-1 [Dactylellina cionopaga]|nr:Ankyrin-1 [Dactylellina cionopaga]
MDDYRHSETEDLNEESPKLGSDVSDLINLFDMQCCIECVKNAGKLVSMTVSMFTDAEGVRTVDFGDDETIYGRVDGWLNHVSSPLHDTPATEQVKNSLAIIKQLLAQFDALGQFIEKEDLVEAEVQCVCVIDAVKAAYGTKYRESTLFQRALYEKSAVFRMRGLLDDADAWLALSQKLCESRLSLDLWEIVDVPKHTSTPQEFSDIPPKAVALFFNSIRKADIRKVRELMNTHPKIINYNYNGEVPTHWAAWFRTPDILSLLLSRGADVNFAATISEAYTPLHHAANIDDIYIIGLLVQHGADLNAIDKDSWTPLHYAVRKNNLDAVQALIFHGALVDCIENLDGWTPLNYAVDAGKIKLVKILLEGGADINRKGPTGMTPLIQSIKRGQYAMPKLLVKCGADINYQDDGCKTARDYSNKRMLLAEAGEASKAKVKRRKR